MAIRSRDGAGRRREVRWDGKTYGKYRIEHTDGTPLKGEKYFVLRLDSDNPEEAARVAAAMRAYKNEPRNCDGFGGDFKMLHKAWFDWTGSPSGQNADGTVKLTFAEWLLAHQSEDNAACRSHLLQAKMDAEKPINPEAKPLRVCDVNTLESLSNFIVKIVLSSDHMKAAPDCYRRLVEASIRTALKVAYEPANINNIEQMKIRRNTK